MLQGEYKIRVGYKDTDRMGIVHHSNYIVYYETARTELMRSLGLSYAEMEARGVMMPILDVQSHYMRPAQYDDILTVRVTMPEMPMARIRFEYEIFDSAGNAINRGSTVLGFLHSDTRRPCRAPQWFVELLAEASDGH